MAKPTRRTPSKLRPHISTRTLSAGTLLSTWGLWVVTMNCTLGKARCISSSTVCCHRGCRCISISSMSTKPGVSNTACSPS